MLQKLWAKYRTLKKSRHRPGSSPEENEALFKADLQDLFDIAHQDALSLMTNEEDKVFLIMQREDTRSCSMGGKDKILEGREARKHERALAGAARKQKQQTSTASCSHADEMSDGDSVSDDLSDPDYQQLPRSSASLPKRLRSPVQVITPHVAAALDRAKVSDRGATFVVASIVQSVGVDLDDVVLSRSSICRARAVTCKEAAADIKQNFLPDKPLLLHWDGKLLPDIAGESKLVDRNAVLISAGGMEQLLAVLKIDRGTGENQANAYIQKLDD